MDQVRFDTLVQDNVSYIQNLLANHSKYSDVNVSKGSNFYDLVIYPMALILADQIDTMDSTGNKRAFTEQSTLEEIDNIASNLFVSLPIEDRSIGSMTLHYNRNKVNYFIPKDSELESKTDTTSVKVYVLNDTYVNEGTLTNGSNSYHITVPIYCSLTDTVAQNSIGSYPGYMPYLNNIENSLISPRTFSYTPEYMKQMIYNSLSPKNMLTERGIRYLLGNNYSYLKTVKVVGYGDDLMQRDVLYAANHVGVENTFRTSGPTILSGFWGKKRGLSTPNPNVARFLISEDKDPAVTDGLEVTQYDYYCLSATDSSTASYRNDYIIEDRFNIWENTFGFKTAVNGTKASPVTTITVDDSSQIKSGDIVRILISDGITTYTDGIKTNPVTSITVEDSSRIAPGDMIRILIPSAGSVPAHDVYRVVLTSSLDVLTFADPINEDIPNNTVIEVNGNNTTHDVYRLVKTSASNVLTFYIPIYETIPNDTVVEVSDNSIYTVGNNWLRCEHGVKPGDIITNQSMRISQNALLIGGNPAAEVNQSNPVIELILRNGLGNFLNAIQESTGQEIDFNTFQESYNNNIGESGNNFSPIIMQQVDIDKNMKIQMTVETNADYASLGTDEGILFIQTSKNSSPLYASALDGFGVAIKPSSVSSVQTTIVSVGSANQDGSIDIVVSDNVFENPSSANTNMAYIQDTNLRWVPIDYTSTVAVTGGYKLAGCYIPTTVTPVANMKMSPALPNVFIVNIGYDYNDNVTDLIGSTTLASKQIKFLPNVQHDISISIGDDYAISVTIDEIGISTGSAVIPINKSLPGTASSIGISVYQTKGYTWTIDDIEVKRLSNTYPSVIYTLDASQLGEIGSDIQLMVDMYSVGSGAEIRRHNGTSWDLVSTITASNTSGTYYSQAVPKIAEVEYFMITSADSSSTQSITLNINNVALLGTIAKKIHMGGCVDILLDGEDYIDQSITAQCVNNIITLTKDMMDDIGISVVTIENVMIKYDTTNTVTLHEGNDYSVFYDDINKRFTGKENINIRLYGTYADQAVIVNCKTTSTPVSVNQWIRDNQDEMVPFFSIMAKNIDVVQISIYSMINLPDLIKTDLENYITSLPFVDGLKTVSLSGFMAYITNSYSINDFYLVKTIRSVDTGNLTVISGTAGTFTISENEIVLVGVAE